MPRLILLHKFNLCKSGVGVDDDEVDLMLMIVREVLSLLSRGV